MIGFVLGAAVVLCLVLARSWLTSFPAQKLTDYDGDGAVIDLPTHLNGHLQIDGVIFGPTGRVVSRFSGDFEGVWDGDCCVLKEHYRYASGKDEYREWRLTLKADGSIRAIADDVVGFAEGRQRGPAVQMRYRFRMEEDAGGHILNATDWMYLAPDGAVVNRSQFRKLGFKVAELLAVMRPKEDL